MENNANKSFRAGIHILVQKGSKFLLLKKSAHDKNDPNHWDLPGGGIEFGEQPFEAAVREAKEEAGIKVGITKIFAVWAMPNSNQWSIEFLVQGRYINGRIKLSPEHSAFQWVKKQELKKYHPRSVHLQTFLRYSLN